MNTVQVTLTKEELDYLLVLIEMDDPGNGTIEDDLWDKLEQVADER